MGMWIINPIAFLITLKIIIGKDFGRFRLLLIPNEDAAKYSRQMPIEKMHTDDFYEEVSKEMEGGQLIPGVWTRAVAEADGDENRAKAIYIKRRVSQLAIDEAELKAKEDQFPKKNRRNKKLRQRYGFQ
jgi:hypothetical protein